MTLPKDAKERKAIPLTTGVLDYFPDAIAAVAETSRVGNEQHNPGQPLHWSKGKSTDHADCLVRHLLERGTVDTDGLRHSAKVAWRALALLQTEIEDARGAVAVAPDPSRRVRINTINECRRAVVMKINNGYSLTVIPLSWALGVWRKPLKTIYALGPLRVCIHCDLGAWGGS